MAAEEEEVTVAGIAEDPHWWRSGTVYQVYPRSFRDSDGDGVGDLRGIIRQVDHLAWLGVDAVWLSPFYPSPQKDNGYDISDYQGVDETFGSLQDVDELVGALHDRGIRLVLDLVVNHTSDQHPWFLDSRSSRTDPRRGWYIWHPGRPGLTPGTPGAEPTNWESFFSESVWQYDEPTGEYYLHLFATEQPDLDWDEPAVRRAVHEMMNWWLDRGVDGFRMDVINLISKRRPLVDGPLLPHGRGDGRHWYNHGPRLHEFLREMHREVFAHRSDALVRIGETPDTTVDQARALSDRDDTLLDMVFQFEHVTLDRDPHDWNTPRPLDRRAVYDNLVAWQTGMGDTGWNSLYWSNHDQPRPVSRFGDDSPECWARSAKTLATVLYLMKGTAFVYQGDEIGMTNFPFTSLAQFADVASVNYIRAASARGVDEQETLRRLRTTSRDNARTPVQWAPDAHGGFSDERPWFPVNPAAAQISVAAQRHDPDSVLWHYRAVIAARKECPAVADGTFADLPTDDDRVVGYDRETPGQRLRVVANLSSDAVPTRLAARPSWATRHRLAVGGEPEDAALQPWQSVVWLG